MLPHFIELSNRLIDRCTADPLNPRGRPRWVRDARSSGRHGFHPGGSASAPPMTAVPAAARRRAAHHGAPDDARDAAVQEIGRPGVALLRVHPSP
jgi:hypothetical protein